MNADLILEHFRTIRSEMGELKTSMVEAKERLAFSKRNTAVSLAG